MAPSTPADFAGMMKTVLASDTPTIWIDHAGLTPLTGPAPDGDVDVPLGKADVKRAGRDVTLVAYSITLPRSLNVARKLAAEGIEVEVVDLRTLAPLDRETVCRSVARTGRLIVADEAHLTCGVAAEIVASVAEAGLATLRRVKRLAVPDTPIPMSPALEAAVMPTEERIEAAVREVLA